MLDITDFVSNNNNNVESANFLDININSKHPLFDVFELIIFLWFCEIWVMGQEMDHVRNNILRKERDKFF